jgi:hypothetical protein
VIPRALRALWSLALDKYDAKVTAQHGAEWQAEAQSHVRTAPYRDARRPIVLRVNARSGRPPECPVCEALVQAVYVDEDAARYRTFNADAGYCVPPPTYRHLYPCGHVVDAVITTNVKESP